MGRPQAEETALKVQLTLYGAEIDAISAEAERTGVTRQRILADYAMAYLRHLTAERQAEAIGSPLLDRLEMLEKTMAAEHDRMQEDLLATHNAIVQLSDFVDLAVQAILGRLPSVPADAQAGARAALAESYAAILDKMLKKRGRIEAVLAQRAVEQGMAE